MSAKIVIVDDDRDMREALRAVFEARGFQVVLAQSGLRLISHLHVDRPDLIVLDVMMSWIDGFELCRALKRNPEFALTPLVFISGRGDQSDVREGLLCGAVAYFIKPIDIEELLLRVNVLLQRSGVRHLA